MTNISLTLTSKLRLAQAIKNAGIENPATVARLTVAGTMTDDDFAYIRENMRETLQELDMGEALVVEIGDYAFSGCAGLTAVVLPASAVEIDDYAFYECAGLTSVFIPASVVKTGNVIFHRCTGLTSIAVHPDNPVFASDDGVWFNRDKTVLISCPEGRQGDYVVPASVTKIGKYAFSDCTGLTSVSLPASVQTIEYGAFEGCAGLTSIVVPATVTVIAENTFADCTNQILGSRPP